MGQSYIRLTFNSDTIGQKNLRGSQALYFLTDYKLGGSQYSLKASLVAEQ